MTTPYKKFYDALVSEIKSGTGELVTDLTEVEGNIVDYSGAETNPKEDTIQSGDVPEVVPYLSRVTGNFHANSSTAEFKSTWRCMISSGVYNSDKIFIGTFLVTRAMFLWTDWAKPLQWRNREFIREVNISQAEVGESIPEANRNIHGWACVADFDVIMRLQKDDFRLGLES